MEGNLQWWRQTEHESRFGLGGRRHPGVGNLMRADWPREGLAAVGPGRSHPSFSIERTGCQDLENRVPEGPGLKNCCCHLQPIRRRMRLADVGRAGGGSKTLCFRWPRARECDGDPTGQRPRRGRPRTTRPRGKPATAAHLQSHCTAQAPVCAQHRPVGKPKPWVNNPPLLGDRAMRGTADTARTVGNGELHCEIDSEMHATRCPWRRRVCDAGLRGTRIGARDQAQSSRGWRDG